MSCTLAILRCACTIYGTSRWRMRALGAPLDRGRAVRNLVGRLAGVLRGRIGVGSDIYHTAKIFASVSPYFCNWLWRYIILTKAIPLKETENKMKKLSTIYWGSAPVPHFLLFLTGNRRFCPPSMTFHLPSRAKRAVVRERRSILPLHF